MLGEEKFGRKGLGLLGETPDSGARTGTSSGFAQLPLVLPPPQLPVRWELGEDTPLTPRW